MTLIIAAAELLEIPKGGQAGVMAAIIFTITCTNMFGGVRVCLLYSYFHKSTADVNSIALRMVGMDIQMAKNPPYPHSLCLDDHNQSK